MPALVGGLGSNSGGCVFQSEHNIDIFALGHWKMPHLEGVELRLSVFYTLLIMPNHKQLCICNKLFCASWAHVIFHLILGWQVIKYSKLNNVSVRCGFWDRSRQQLMNIFLHLHAVEIANEHPQVHISALLTHSKLRVENFLYKDLWPQQGILLWNLTFGFLTIPEKLES